VNLARTLLFELCAAQQKKGADEDGWKERENQMSKGGEVDQFHE
jgi:hypothetical protein